MPWWVWVIIGVAIVVAPLLIGLLFSGQAMSGSGGGGAGVFGVFDEVFSPARHSATQEREQQQLRREDAGVPDDLDPTRARHVAHHPGDHEIRHPEMIPTTSTEPTHTRSQAPPPGWLHGQS